MPLPIADFVEISSNVNSSSQSSISSSVSANSVSTSSITNSGSNQTSISAISSTLSILSVQSSTKSDVSYSSKSVSFLDILFGSVKADAATNDGWRLPYASGQRPTLQQKPYGTYSHQQYTAFDFNNANNIIINAKAGTVIFKQFQAVNSSGKNSYGGFGNHILVKAEDGSVALYGHLQEIYVNLNDFLTQGATIGIQGNSGFSTASHLHFETFSTTPCGNNSGPESCWQTQSYYNARMLPQFDECYAARGGLSNTISDCINGYPNSEGKWYESINSFKNVLPAQANYNFVLDDGCQNGNGTAVYVYTRVNNDCQKMRYNNTDYTISNPWGKCLDAGDINNSGNRWLRFSNCHGGYNQKWFQGTDGRIWTYQKNSSNQPMCIEYNGLYNQAGVNVNPCSGSQNQKWYFDLGIYNWNVPSSYNTWQLQRNGTNQCIASNNPSDGSSVYTTNCNANDQDQLWESVPNNVGGNMFRRKNTTKCIDKYYASNGSMVYTWECDVNATNHAWSYNSNNKLINQIQTSNQCLAKYNPQVNSQINTSQCNANDGNLQWNAILQ